MSKKYTRLSLADADGSAHASNDVAVSITDSPTDAQLCGSDESPFIAAAAVPVRCPSGDGGLSTTSSIDGDESSELMPHDKLDESTRERASSSGSSSSSGGGVAGLIVLDPSPPSEGEVSVTLMRLGGTGLGNVRLNVPLDWTVHEMVERVYAREIHELHQRVRVLFSGRILKDDDQFGAVGVTDGCILHTHISDAPEGGWQGAPVVDMDSQEEGGGGDVLIPMEGEGGQGALAGYPAHYDAAHLEQLRQAQLQLEAELQHIGPREGSNSELLIGFFCGFVLGWLCLICLYSPALSRKQRLGILLGLTLNLVLLILQYLDPPQPLDPNAIEPPVDPREGAQGITNS